MKDGILFIGDPHITACKPGRRTDEDFLETSLDKLRQGLDIAKINNLIPVITGDLVDSEYERKTIVPLIQALYGHDAIILGGNHDRKQLKVKGDTTLSILKASKICRIIDEPGLVQDVTLDGTKVSLYMVPYGYEIPSDIRDECSGEKVVMVTHADIDLDGSFNFPGMIKPFQIKGCDLVVNGHLHLEQSPISLGGTLWTNPGNILRMSVDCRGHVPAVHAWVPKKDGLRKFTLEYMEDVFDMSGYIPPKDKALVLQDMESKFAKLLKEQSGLQKNQTTNGDMIQEEMDTIFSEKSYSEATEIIINNLKSKAVAELQESLGFF